MDSNKIRDHSALNGMIISQGSGMQRFESASVLRHTYISYLVTNFFQFRFHITPLHPFLKHICVYFKTKNIVIHFAVNNNLITSKSTRSCVWNYSHKKHNIPGDVNLKHHHCENLAFSRILLQDVS